jgi:hypothetical protein
MEPAADAAWIMILIKAQGKGARLIRKRASFDGLYEMN